MTKQEAIERFGLIVVDEAEGYYCTDFDKDFWLDLDDDEQLSYLYRAESYVHATPAPDSMRQQPQANALIPDCKYTRYGIYQVEGIILASVETLITRLNDPNYHFDFDTRRDWANCLYARLRNAVLEKIQQ